MTAKCQCGEEWETDGKSAVLPSCLICETVKKFRAVHRQSEGWDGAYTGSAKNHFGGRTEDQLLRAPIV